MYSGPVVVDGRQYTLVPTDISLQRADLDHRIQGLTLKRNGGGVFDYSLSASDYETHYAPDAVASISQARQHHPDLILLDLGLPAGDGFVVMDRLKQIPELSRIPVVVLSGRDRAATEMRSLRSGAAGQAAHRAAGQ